MNDQVRRKILRSIADGTIKVKSVEECAKAEIHLCSNHQNPELKEYEGVCSECGCKVWFTQLFPPDGPQPRKICLDCAVNTMRGENSFGA